MCDKFGRTCSRFLLLGILIASALAFVGCGGGGQATTTTPTQNSIPAGTTVEVSLGDSPADWMMTFGMTVNSITLINSSGGSVSMLSSPAQIEMLGLMGTVEPVSIMKVPQGTYTSASISVSSVQMSYMNPTTLQYMQKTLAGPFTGTVTFNPAMTLGSTADMNMGSSVSIDSSGNVTITPTFTAMMNSLASGQDPWQGWMQHMVGSVASTSGSQFTMNSLMGLQNATFNTSSNTQFVNMSGMGMMSGGTVLSVDAITQSDGSLLAQRVESMWGSGGMMGGGIVTGITGNPPTTLSIVANNGIGGGMMMSAISGNITVNVSSSTPYSYDSDDVDVGNLPFTPTFNSSTIAKGQKVDVISGGGMTLGGMGGGMMGGGTPYGTITASQVRLEPQGLHGTVSNFALNGSQATFTLTLAPDSAFATLTGTSAVTVYKQTGTQMHNLTGIANGNQVGVRGLLFYDAGTYKMVSTWIVAQ
jgi:hypothetical protein